MCHHCHFVVVPRVPVTSAMILLNCLTMCCRIVCELSQRCHRHWCHTKDMKRYESPIPQAAVVQGNWPDSCEYRMIGPDDTSDGCTAVSRR